MLTVCRELTVGIPVFNVDGERVGESRRAAVSAISQVVVSRILMASPGMRQYRDWLPHTCMSCSVMIEYIGVVFLHRHRYRWSSLLVIGVTPKELPLSIFIVVFVAVKMFISLK